MATVDKAEITAAAGRLARRLNGLSDHQRSVWWAESAGLLLAVVVSALGLAMVLDNFFQLHVLVRLVLVAGAVAGAVLVVRRGMHLLRESLTAEQMAVKVEQRFPEIDNRLINSLLLASEDDEGAFQLIHDVIEEGNADAARLPLRAAIPKRTMALFLAASALAIGLMGLYGALWPDQFKNALARVLFPFGSQAAINSTRIVDVQPGDCNILAGRSVTIKAILAGELPESAEVRYRPEGGDTRLCAMHASEGAREFDGEILDVTETFTYSVVAGQAESEEYTVTVQRPPAVSGIEATVRFPAYAGGETRAMKTGKIEALDGSTATITATSSKPLAAAALTYSQDEKPVDMQLEQDEEGQEKLAAGSFRIKGSGSYRVRLTDRFQFSNQPVKHEVKVIPDLVPAIEIASPGKDELKKGYRIDDTVHLDFTVADDHGIQGVEIVQLVQDKESRRRRPKSIWKAPAVSGKALRTRRYRRDIPVAELGLRPGDTGILKIVARDWNDVARPEPPVGQVGEKAIGLRVISGKEARKDQRDAIRQAVEDLAKIIKAQRANIALGEALQARFAKSPDAITKDADELAQSVQNQEDISTATGRLVAGMDETVPIRPILDAVHKNEMVAAVRQLRAVAASKEPAKALGSAVETERIILRELTGQGKSLSRANDNAALRDIFAALEEIIRKQKELRKATDALSQAAAPGKTKPMADRQDALAGEVVGLKDTLVEQARAVAKSDTEAAKRFEQAASMVDSRKIRGNMLIVAGKIEDGQLAPAVPIQDKIIADLKEIEKLLREPVAAQASKKIDDLKDAVEENKEKAEKLAALQAKIKEISEELERSKDLTGDKAKDREEMAAELQDLREKLRDSVEKMAKDLSLFPDIPACNEMVNEAREVFEDIEQAEGSEAKKEAVEIAVDRDEGLLKSLEKIKERLADMEMWMMDKPDGERWKQEGVDKNEIGEIPLVDLPEEMEDIVGDLVDKQDELDQEGQDSTSNAMTPDLPAGWDIADGPISSFGAKGKSGNEKPNANEMTGRSGAGREGQANGEIVEGKAKNLEGREPEARRTRDPFQAGEVEEEEGGHPQKAKATGGGKQSGVGGEGGLRGAAPARDELKMRDLERRQRQLRRNTQALYSKAVLMYLPAGKLSAAILMMQKAEEQARAGDFAGFSETQKRIAKALRDTSQIAQGKSVAKTEQRVKIVRKTKGLKIDAKDEHVPEEYKDLVGEYFKAIAEGALK